MSLQDEFIAARASPYKDRRRMVTALVQKMMKLYGLAHLDPDLTTSPLIGSGPHQINCRTTFNGVLLNTPLEVREGLLANILGLSSGISPKDMLTAIVSPVTSCLTDTSTATGYKFGWPKHWDHAACEAEITSYLSEHGAVLIMPKALSTAPTYAPDTDQICDIHDRVVYYLIKKYLSSSTDDVNIDTCLALQDQARRSIRSVFTEHIISDTKVLDFAFDLIDLRHIQEVTDSISSLTHIDLFRRIYEKEYGPLDVKASELVVQSCGHADKQIKVATSETTSKIIIKKEITEGKSMSLDTDIALAKALDPLLPMVTGGLINDSAGLMGLIREKGVLEGKIIDLTTKLGAAEARASAKPLAIGKIETTTGEFPTGNLETRLASDVFDFKGKTAKAFAFDVPVFDWDAPHPLVPTIDPDYVFDLKNTALILDALVNGDNAWVFGHTGSGKTTIIEQIAARLSWPLMRINGDSDISRFELIGKTDLRDGATVFTEGVLPIGLQNGCIILMDEYDMLRGETAYVLQRLAEGKGLMLLEDGGRYVAPHPMTRLIAACNSRGNGDEFGIYPAVRTQSAAVRSRFTAWVEHDYLKTDQETQLLIKKTGIGEEMAGKFVRLANEVRDAFKRGVILEVVSPRELLAAATRYMRLSSRLGDEREATRMTLESALLSRCSSADRATLSEISQRVFGV